LLDASVATSESLSPGVHLLILGVIYYLFHTLCFVDTLHKTQDTKKQAKPKIVRTRIMEFLQFWV